MKKLIITGFLSISTFIIAVAQETPPPAPATTPTSSAAPAPAPAPVASSQATDNGGGKALMFGLKFTPTYTWFGLDRENYDTDGGYIGYTYGIMMDFRIADNYYFATGVEISQRGGKYKSDKAVISENPLVTTKAEVTQRFQFIDLPFSLKLKTNEIGYTRYYGSFGFLGGVMVKANQDIEFENPAYEDKDKRDNQSDFGSFNFGLLVGAGLEYNFSGNTAVTAGIQYHNAFVDIWAIDNAKMTSSYISLNLGLFF